MINTRNFIDLTIPQYLLIALVSPLSAFMIINQNMPDLNFIYLILSLSFAILGFNTMNSVFDAEIDKVDRPLRPIPSNRISVKEARLLAALLLFISIAISLLVNPFFFTLVATFVMVSYLYSALCLKKYIWGSILTGSVLYGVIPFLSAYSVSNTNFSGFFLFLFTALFAIISSTKDFEDLQGQRKFKLRSLPLIFGSKKTRSIICWSLLALIYLTIASSIFEVISTKFLLPASVWLLGYLIYRHFLISEIEKLQFTKKKIVTQSNIPTVSIIFVLFVQLMFGILSL